jgi:uncharacterized protein (TIGR02246 family)
MKRLGIVAALVLLAPCASLAGPVEDAHAALDGWSAAYTSGDAEGVINSYWPDATLFGIASPVLASGIEAIRKHYASINGSGVQNRIGRRHTIALGPDAVLVAGYYEFLRLQDGKPVSSPARFTILFTRRAGKWRIAHHHSSPYVEPKQ